MTERLAVDPDRLGERAVALALPAGLQPARALSAGGARRPDRPGGTPCSSTGRTRRRSCPVRLQPFLRWRMAAAEEHAWGNMVRHPAGAPGLRRRGARPGARRRAAQGQRPRRAPARPSRGPCGTGTTARSRWSGCSSPARSPPRTARRPSRRSTTSPSGCCRAEVLRDADTRARRRRPRTGAHRRPRAGRGHRARPARLLPAAPGGRPHGRSPSWPTPGSCCRSRSPAGARRPGWTRRRAGPGGSGRGRC